MTNTLAAKLPLGSVAVFDDALRSLSVDVAPLTRAAAGGEHPANVAESVSALFDAVDGETGETRVARMVRQALAEAEPARRAEIFARLSLTAQIATVRVMTRGEVTDIVSHMPHDDRVDLLKRIPEKCRLAIMPALAQVEREDIRRLSSYAEGTAGAAMTSEYASLAPQTTAAQAIERLRLEAPDKETIYYAYVVDEKRRLRGFVSLKDLILAQPEARVGEFMQTEVVFARVQDDQEDAARKIQKYDLIALPVINAEDALVGIITHDDALDIITQEHTEDMEKLMAIAGSHEAGSYLRTTSWVHFKNRAYWIVGLAALGLVSGLIIHSFEATLMQLLILALYMPMVADTGGNTGSQAATMVVRALAVGEIAPRDVFKVLAKEFKVAFLLALVLGALSFGKVTLLSQGADLPAGFTLGTVGGAIALALAVQVVTATVIGAMLPLAAARMKLDPAIVASPALTTVVDITGMLIYFTSAKVLLGV